MTDPAATPFPTLHHNTDFCVVGGGMGGLCAALAAARHGIKVILMQDRPVLGGNASSECRMHICGADRSGSIPHLRETGILEELRLETLARNPLRNFSLWDLVLYDAAVREPNLSLLLNCSCHNAGMDNHRIRWVEGWQTTTQTHQRVHATLFADCSGDSILAPLTGAEVRIGREGRSEFNESIAPEQPDRKTMGMTCLFQARRTDQPQPFHAPAWAHRFNHCDQLPYGARGHGWWELGYWWIELGGEADSIRDTETLRHELLKITLGVWDHIKNSGRHDADCWTLDWLQFLPGKRESRRYVGDHILTQNDIEAGGRFNDVVAYGGWTMDDHDTAGFLAATTGRPATIFHPAPSPYGIPYRSLYAQSIANLFMAGRNISCTHAALSSTRVMGTCSVLGQAVGTAAALAIQQGIDPRDVQHHMPTLQHRLMEDDCFLPGQTRPIPELTRRAGLIASTGDPEPVRDGFSRQIGNHPHAWICPRGGMLTLTFPSAQPVREIRLVLDSGMDQIVAAIFAAGIHPLDRPPAAMPRTFRILAHD
ncbi:MAG: hypothetical protein A2269_03500, partial [Lentisphaerae bacterium RIFOXYA12_FULL_60_10]